MQNNRLIIDQILREKEEELDLTPNEKNIPKLSYEEMLDTLNKEKLNIGKKAKKPRSLTQNKVKKNKQNNIREYNSEFKIKKVSPDDQSSESCLSDDIDIENTNINKNSH